MPNKKITEKDLRVSVVDLIGWTIRKTIKIKGFMVSIVEYKKKEAGKFEVNSYNELFDGVHAFDTMDEVLESLNELRLPEFKVDNEFGVCNVVSCPATAGYTMTFVNGNGSKFKQEDYCEEHARVLGLVK